MLVTEQPTVAAAKTVVSNFTVTACPALNPDPVIEIVLAVVPPTTPEIGDTAIEGVVVVTLADAVL